MQELILSLKSLLNSKSCKIGGIVSLFIVLICALIWGWDQYLFTVGGTCLTVISLWNNVEVRSNVNLEEEKIRKDCNQNWITRMLIIENGMLRTFEATFSKEPLACSITMLHASEIAQECANCCDDPKIKSTLKNCIVNISRYRVQIEQGVWSNSLGSRDAMSSLIITLRNQCNF